MDENERGGKYIKIICKDGAIYDTAILGFYHLTKKTDGKAMRCKDVYILIPFIVSKASDLIDANVIDDL